MQTTVNFVRGLHGMGVVIEIIYGTDRVIFDFGAPFEPLTQIYDGTVLPRFRNRVKDSILLNKAPLVDYVYKKEDLKDINLQPSENSPYQTAVFISHCHLDHMSEIDKIDPQIPVYLHESGYRLKKALEEIGEEETIRDYAGFQYHQTIEVGVIKVTPYFSDHACIGSAGFLIETPDSRIYYSGDIRFHALEAEKAYKEIEKYNHDIDLLIVDSTTTSASEFIDKAFEPEQLLTPSKTLFEGMISEGDIYEDCYQQLKEYPGLGVFNLYHRDIRMLQQMNLIAQRVGRTAVFEPETAYLFNQLTGEKVTIIESDTRNKLPYYQKVLSANTLITKQDIQAQPEKYLLQNSYRNILELTDYQATKAIYFHLFGQPLTVKEKHYTILRNFLNKLQWQYFSYINLYSFSHAYPNNLAYFIEQVNAKSVVAVHSKHPENLNPVNSKHYLPKERTVYRLVDGQLIEC